MRVRPNKKYNKHIVQEGGSGKKQSVIRLIDKNDGFLWFVVLRMINLGLLPITFRMCVLFRLNAHSFYECMKFVGREMMAMKVEHFILRYKRMP